MAEKKKSHGFKAVLVTIIILGIVAGGFYCTMKYTSYLDSIKGFFFKDVKIEETANIVEEIKKSGEFTSACFYDEFAMHFSKNSNNAMLAKIGINKTQKDEVVLIAKGKVRAGFDLQKIADNDILVKGDTLSIALPPAEIFDVITNPSDFEFFTEKGSWSHEQETFVKTKANERLKEDALKNDILEKARTVGISKLESMYKTLGFSVVELSVKEETFVLPE